jgi:dipeptidyl aminopeptidase/acylaminoacyl peptidase
MDLPPIIPRRTIFGNPTRAEPQISPDGERLAYLAPVDGVLNVLVGSVDADDARPVTRDTDRGIRMYFWAYDGRNILYLQDVGGDENWRLFVTAIDSTATRELTPFPDVQVQILAYDKHFPNQMLIGMNKENPQAHDVYHLDIPTGALTRTAENPGNVIHWIPDTKLRIRGRQLAREDAGFDLEVRDDENAEWQHLLTWSAEDSLNAHALFFAANGRALHLVDPRNANTGRLVKLDIQSGAIDVMAEDPIYDVANVMVHPDTYEIQAVAFERAHTEWQVLDASIAADVAAIRRIDRGDFHIYDRTDADDIWLVGFTKDTGPAGYYALERSTKHSRLLFHTRPELVDAPLVPMEPISFQSRDGLTIHGYVTKPMGVSLPGPMVLNVHGGPWHRDAWGYDPEAQWLANRGYVVLQLNFRGSTGYGKRFLNAGDREWGGRMHDDLIDGVQWAVDAGIADAERVAIYGGSYGGYAALVGATFTPEQFRCAVAIVGPSNLITFINSVPPYWSAFLQMLYRRVGHPERDEAFLIERSPLTHVDRIKIPMLIAQGANDPRVKQAESEQIVAAMREKGIDHEYMLFPDEGHGFAKPDNRLKFYAAAERFLAKHLGGRYEQDEASARAK